MTFNLIPTKLFLSRLEKLDNSILREVEKKLDKLKENPIVSEHRMHHAHNFFRLYLRNFRIIYKVDGQNIILFDLIKRSEGYEKYK